MNLFQSYTQNIALILIFTSFMGLILPGGKYKGYIRLIMGLMVILFVMAPVLKLINSDTIFDDMLTAADRQLNMSSVKLEGHKFEDSFYESVVAAHKDGLKSQMAGKIPDFGFNMVDADIYIDESDENFGSITGLDIFVTKGQNAKQKLIKVDKVSVGKPEKKELQNENKETDELKNFLCDFYNLSADNIYIKVLEF